MTITLQTKCYTCIHAPVCVNNLGGADLDIIGDDCQHYKPNTESMVLPTKFYIIFGLPGLYNIIEYAVERVSYFKGALDKMWGVSKQQSKAVAYAVDIGRTVFFTIEEAETGLKKLNGER